MLGVSPATISKWENSKSSPNSTNLTLLAISLNTTTDYLQGLTDDPSSLRAKADTVVQAESTSPATTQPGLCEDCGTPVPERVRKCPSCRWKTRWPESVLNSPRLASRRKRSHSVHPFYHLTAKSPKLYSARQPTRTEQLTSQRLSHVHAVILR